MQNRMLVYRRPSANERKGSKLGTAKISEEGEEEAKNQPTFEKPL
jgi:hypothetical protein